jgi:hypothetical protein
MGEVIGQSTTGTYSTWGKLRCPLINGYDQFTTDANVSPQPHNLMIDSGFHPNGGLFLRVAQWPQTTQWFDADSNLETEYDGPIVGFYDVTSVKDSHFSVGAYNWSGNGDIGGWENNYTSINNFLDQGDIDDSLIGLTVTYDSGTFVTDADAFTQTPTTSPWLGQDIGANTITSVTAIDTFTAF